MEFRNADSRHVDWVKALKQLFQQLKAYVKQHHMAGPSWNPRGIPLTEFKADNNASAASNPAPAPPSASAPRPPPPGICQHHKRCFFGIYSMREIIVFRRFSKGNLTKTTGQVREP